VIALFLENGIHIRKTIILRSAIDELFWEKEDIEKYGIQVLSLK